MKLYTLEFNCNTPTTQQVNIPTNTDYMVGIKVTKNGGVLDIDPSEITLGGTAADATKTNGYVTFTMASGDNAKYESKVVAIEMEDGFKATFTLNLNVYKSQQGDIGVSGSGGGVTEDWVESYVSAETSAFVTGDGYGQAPKLSAMTSVYASDWTTLSSTADENTMYVVLPDPVLLTRVKYTTASGLPDWEGDIVGSLDGTEESGGVFGPTTQIPNVTYAEDVTIGSNLSAIGAYAFFVEEEGLPLKSVTIGNSVTSIGDCSFEYCNGLSSMIIPDSVTTIGESAFGYCTGITSITIPASVTTIGMWAFADSGIMDITFSGKTMAQVETMATNKFYWSLTSGCVIHCSDGDITVSQ